MFNPQCQVSLAVSVEQLSRLKELLEKSIASTPNPPALDSQLLAVILAPLRQIKLDEACVAQIKEAIEASNEMRPNLTAFTECRKDCMTSEFLRHYGVSEIPSQWSDEQIAVLVNGKRTQGHALSREYQYLSTYENIITLVAINTPFHLFHLIGIYPDGEMKITL
jgi:hypothetical protein